MSEFQIMTPKLHARAHETWTQYVFWCPACGDTHHYNGLNMQGKPILWEFNGNVECPSFTPSLLVTGHDFRCHLYVTDGMIHYCPDCSHALAGKIVPMEDMP